MAAPIVANPGQNLTQDDWNALVAQHGGVKSVAQRKLTTEEEIRKNALETPDDPQAEQRPFYIYSFNDGSYIQTRTTADGQFSNVVEYHPSQAFTQDPANKPANATNTGVTGSNPRVPPGSTSRIEGTPTGQVDAKGNSLDGQFDNSQPVRAWHTPDGTTIREPLQAGDADYVQWQKNKNGGLTDAEMQQRNAQNGTKEEPVNGRPGWVQITTTQSTPQGPVTTIKFRGPDKQIVDTLPAVPGAPTLKPDGKGGTIAVQTMPDGSIKVTPLEGVPSDKPQPERVTVNGQVYERNPQSGQYTPAKGLPTTGEATVGGPPMVHIIAGHAEEALTAYHKALWNDSSLTPEQREKRFQEAVQVGNIAINEATTAQRERESQRNADYNTASTKLTYMENSTQAALTFVSGLIGKITPGSGLGGQAFAALMGLQALNMKASGINDLKPAGTSAQPLTSQLALNNPTKLAEQTSAIGSQVAAAAGPTPPLNQGQDLSTPRAVDPPSAPGLGAPLAPAASPAPSSTTLPPNRPDQTQAAPQIENAINPPEAPVSPSVPQPPLAAPYQDDQRDPAAPSTPPDYGQPGIGVLPQPQPQPAPQPPTEQPADAPSADTGVQQGPPIDMVTVIDPISQRPITMPRNRYNRQSEDWRRQHGEPVSTPGADPNVTRDPTVDPSGVDPQSRAPGADWSALSALQQPPSQQPQQPAPPQQTYSDSPALLHAEAASRPPWQMSQQDYERYKAAGVSDDVIMGVPRRSAA